MKKLSLVILIIILNIPLTSCALKFGDFNEINELYFVTCIGVDEEEHKYEILPQGYCVFKGKRMIGYLNKEQSLGVDWINNTEIKPSLVIDDKAFGKLTTKVDSFQTKLTPLIFEQESKKIILLMLNFKVILEKLSPYTKMKSLNN